VQETNKSIMISSKVGRVTISIVRMRIIH